MGTGRGDDDATTLRHRPKQWGEDETRRPRRATASSGRAYGGRGADAATMMRRRGDDEARRRRRGRGRRGRGDDDDW